MSRFTNHTTSSSYLQPPITSTQLPPSSFRGTGGIRNSLKKIPSSLFGDKHKSKMPTTDENSAPRSFKSSAIPSFLSNNASPPRADKTKLQKKTKTRKGLGEIFGWSHNNNAAPTVSPPIISAPSALLPSPPRLQREPVIPARAKDNIVKENIIPKEIIMPRQARRTSSKSSIPGLAGWTSLRPPAETPAKPRPSMAADPFGRTDVGAERVDQVQQCGELYERRGSVSSGKALSSSTCDSSEQSKRTSVSSGKALSSKTFGTDRRGSISSSKAFSTKTVDSDYTIKYQGHAEIRRAKHMSPVPARATLVELPSRANSTIRRPSIPIPSPRQLASAQPIVDTQASPKAIKKEKTRSRVWGLLGLRSKKSKDLLSKATPPVGYVAPVRSIGKKDQDTLTPSKVPKRVSSIHALKAHDTTKYSSRGAMPWPPSLHITQPSVDAQAPFTLSTLKQGDDFNPSSSDIDPRMYPRSIPKRKSLNGLFGVSMKEAESFRSRHASEPVEEENVIQPSPPYISRFADVVPSISRSNTLRRVASATDKLVDLVTGFDFSPVSRKTITAMDSLSSIAETIKEAHEGSPTPMRKVKSAVLSIRGVSPMRHGPNVSPLKLALHRKQLEAPSREVLRKRSSQNIFAPASPLPPMPTRVDINARFQPSAQADQVVKVTVSVETAARSLSPPPLPAHTALPPPPRPARRNIFAPPTPQVTAAALASLQTTDETVGKPKYRPVSCISAFTDRVEHDVPQDLRDLFIDADHILSATASPAHVEGLPRPPPSDRRPASGRRRRNPPPAELPPSPPTPQQPTERHQIPRDSMQSEFDFDGEFANLDQGNQRASFVEALHRATGDYHAHDLPPLPPLPERGDYSMDQFDDASERASGSSTDTVIVAAAHRRERKSPFAGTFAFQQHVSHVKTSTSPPLEDVLPEIQIQEEEDQEPTDYQVYKDAARAEDDTMELAVPPTRRGHRARRQDEAGVSIATMSSLGDVIETGIAGDYTNYFEAEFAKNVKDNTQTSAFDFSKSHSRQSSSISTSARHRRGHSRNTSIASLASIDGLEMPSVPEGPPRTMHNRKRSSYISKHRSGNSFDFSNGRSDWAASHRRMQSDDSAMSNMSASRISRPGLGARMFELDGGVQLTSITGSPADGYDQDQQDKDDDEESCDDQHNVSKTTYYSTFENQDSFHTALDTSFDSEVESSAKESDWSDKRTSAGSGSSRDSIFGPGAARGKGSFLLRPISAITTDSSSNEEDTFINVSKSITNMRRAPSCIEAQGEDTMTPVNVVRPRKPRSDRRRHVQLALESDLETPGLTSPSTSEASSRMSLETRFSEGPHRGFFAGHRRQQSSVVVVPQPTIREEVSGNLEGATVQRYLDWEREANVECQRAKSQWRDSEESMLAVQDFKDKLPSSSQEMLEYIAQSTLAFAPLTQQQLPKAHRRKSSLSEARASLSPYGHPLARPPVHGGVSHFAQFATAPSHSPQEGQPQKKRPSLQTKFERTNSATTSHFPDAEITPPSSAIFAQFTRDTPPTPPPVLTELPAMSPFKMSSGYTPTKAEVKEKRPRVDSEVRRQKLGWGKRANSDGPARVIAALEPVPRIPLAFITNRPSVVPAINDTFDTSSGPNKVGSAMKSGPRAPLGPVKNKVFVDNVPVTKGLFVNPRKVVRQADENARPNVSPTKKSVAKRPSRRAPRMMSSVPTLRA